MFKLVFSFCWCLLFMVNLLFLLGLLMICHENKSLAWVCLSVEVIGMGVFFMFLSMQGFLIITTSLVIIMASSLGLMSLMVLFQLSFTSSKLSSF